MRIWLYDDLRYPSDFVFAGFFTIVFLVTAPLWIPLWALGHLLEWAHYRLFVLERKKP